MKKYNRAYNKVLKWNSNFFIYVQLLILNINTFVKNFKIIKNEFLFFRFLDR